MALQKKKEQIPVSWDYTSIVTSEDKPAEVLLLHGFMQTAERIAKQVSSVIEAKGLKFRAPQAPFPVYKQLPDRYQVGYSWYFYDHISKNHVVPKSVGARFVMDGLKAWGELNSIHTVIGFSQGAYLAAHLGKLLPSVKKVIGIGGRFYAADFSSVNTDLEIYQIHGLKDQVVDPELTQAEHELLVKDGFNSRFLGLEGVGHEINDAVRNKLSELI